MTIYQKFVDINIKFKSYDFEFRKSKRKNEFLNINIAKQNLILFKKISDKYNLCFFLIYGTLLGAIRENNFIKHDTDTDIGILEKDRKKFFNMIPDLLEKGFEIIRTKEPDDLVTFMRNDEYIDVGIFKSENENYFSYQGNYINNYFLEKLDKMTFLNQEFHIPNNSIELLIKLYGNSWKIPYKNEPAINLDKTNYYNRIKRSFLRTKIGKIVKHIYVNLRYG